jgi:hypothetical protein
MEHILSFKGVKMNDELLSKFMDSVNHDHQKIIIYLSCTGGEQWVSDIMVDVVNKNPERFEIIGAGHILSAAFCFFFDSRCKKRIMRGTIGMIHQGITDVSLNDNLMPAYSLDIACHKRLKNSYYPDGLDFIKRIGLNKKEIKKYKKGHDVYFQPDRLLELFNNQVK